MSATETKHSNTLAEQLISLRNTRKELQESIEILKREAVKEILEEELNIFFMLCYKIISFQLALSRNVIPTKFLLVRPNKNFQLAELKNIMEKFQSIKKITLKGYLVLLEYNDIVDIQTICDRSIHSMDYDIEYTTPEKFIEILSKEFPEDDLRVPVFICSDYEVNRDDAVSLVKSNCSHVETYHEGKKTSVTLLDKSVSLCQVGNIHKETYGPFKKIIDYHMEGLYKSFPYTVFAIGMENPFK
ncbi:MAG: hypothetical protein Edafosvirus5_67 [Edafosvirus sp.]|uniref:Uncharacterized protein n=1 Tax=Edafosvirus sp. TaxID=2487765 RepID=A0A3G4ZXK4_9VIRU|nr:MAG: hypothetical protein Edafosvirus5_67 [Edafosvirus sp.]